MNQINNSKKNKIKETVKEFDIFIFNISIDIVNDYKDLNKEIISLLSLIKDEQKTCKLVTNSSMRIRNLIKYLSAGGVVPSFYQEINSSGEKMHRLLLDQKDPFHAKLGKKCYMFSCNDYDASFINDLDYEKVSSIETAEFIIVFRRLDVQEQEQLFLQASNKPVLFINSKYMPDESYKLDIIRSYDISPFDIKEMIENGKRCAYMEITNDVCSIDSDNNNFVLTDDCTVLGGKDLLC